MKENNPGHVLPVPQEPVLFCVRDRILESSKVMIKDLGAQG